MTRFLYLLILYFSISIFFIDCKKDDKNNNQAPNETINLKPSNQAIKRGIDVLLGWQCSDPENDVLTYDVYFSKSSIPLLAFSNLSAASYKPSDLEFNTLYYWKIVAKDNNGNSTSGPTWSFTTAANQSEADRKKILDDYNDIFLATNITNIGWTGNTDNCNPGTISQEVQTKTLQRINYFRTLAGLPGDVIFDNVKNAKCQQAAMMCHANGQLNHTPPNTWKCFTLDGYAGTSNSNLAMGAVGPNAVTLFMTDPGSSNTACGHRRWILYSREKVMGHGSTSSYDCLWTLGNTGNPLPLNMPEFICWPPKNYVVYTFVFPRWSFSVPGASYTNTTVTMTDENNNDVPLAIISYKDNSYGDNTIVWEPNGIITTGASDITYNVKVNDVSVGGNLKNYEYKVIIIHPDTKKSPYQPSENGEVL